METGKVVLGALAGIAIGAVVGVLLAPDKGSETRRKLATKGGEYTDGLKDKFGGLKDKYNSLVDGVTEKLESYTGGSDSSTTNRESASGTSGMKTAGATAGAGSSASGRS